MDGILQFLLIAGLIAIGIIKQIKKEAKKKDIILKPENEYNPFPRDQKAERSFFPESSTFEVRKSTFSEEKKIKKPIAPPLNTSAPPKAKATSTEVPICTASETESEFRINSIEEARKAIVWSEILQRKY